MILRKAAVAPASLARGSGVPSARLFALTPETFIAVASLAKTAVRPNAEILVEDLALFGRQHGLGVVGICLNGRLSECVYRFAVKITPFGKPNTMRLTTPEESLCISHATIRP